MLPGVCGSDALAELRPVSPRPKAKTPLRRGAGWGETLGGLGRSRARPQPSREKGIVWQGGHAQQKGGAYWTIRAPLVERDARLGGLGVENREVVKAEALL